MADLGGDRREASRSRLRTSASLVVAIAVLAGCGTGTNEQRGGGATTVTIGDGASTVPQGGQSGGGSSVDPASLPGDCPGDTAAPRRGGAGALEQATYCLIDAIRAERGLGMLERDGRLARAATRHSRDMARNNYFAHVSPQGRDLTGWVRPTGYLAGRQGYRLAENIAFGTGAAGTPRQIVAGWMSSRSHRRNILDGRLSGSGVGVVIGSTRPDPPATGAVYTQVFGG